MLPTPENYRVYPSVLPVGEQTVLTLLAAELSYLPVEGEEYTLVIIAVDADENYYEPKQKTSLTLRAEDGVLRFSHIFPEEGMYRIRLMRGNTRLCDTAVYALASDLYSLVPLKGDLHTHSYRSDGVRDPAALAGHIREQGYDFFALTDHNRYYPGLEIDETYAGVKTGLLRIPGEEIHAPKSPVHIVHIGGEKSVASEYIHDRERYEAEVKEYEARVPADLPAEYAYRYARAMWATDKIHEAGGIAIFPHPYWHPAGNTVNVPAQLARILLSSGMFDAFELMGAAGQAGRNRQLALWQELREAGVRIPPVGSSDVHSIKGAESFPHIFTLLFAESKTREGVLSAVRAGRSVAVEATGVEYERTYRAYGSLRLVSYAQFLLRYFYPNATRIAAGEGVLLRAYAIGECDSAAVEAVALQAENYRARFFGKMAPVLPTAEMLDAVSRWRDRQRNEGPLTMGSLIDGAENRNI